MKYKYISHTADAKLQAFGKTLEEAFSNSALAMFNIMTDTSKLKPRIKHKISIKSENQEALLYDFLEKLVFFIDTEGFLLAKVNKLKIKDNKLEAEVSGEKFTNQDVHSYIKAVTYNDMFIRKEKEKYIVQVVLDI
ncbi:MAG: archease [Candidatus Woesearchaeota archaeon]|nr:MAG: archease [Candidatus Woesearchaeota archaeon]